MSSAYTLTLEPDTVRDILRAFTAAGFNGRARLHSPAAAIDEINEILEAFDLALYETDIPRSALQKPSSRITVRLTERDSFSVPVIFDKMIIVWITRDDGCYVKVGLT